jgi:hypothetical protein
MSRGARHDALPGSLGMTRKQPGNLPASVHARLRNIARETERSFNEILQFYGMERFLYRLGRSRYASRV